MFTESKNINQITILPQANAVQVQWSNLVKKNDVVISETFERKVYDAALVGFNTEVGSLDVNAFLTAFNEAALDEKVAALAAKASAEAALTAATTAHTAALTAKDAEIVAAQAQIATLQAQVDALTLPVSEAA